MRLRIEYYNVVARSHSRNVAATTEDTTLRRLLNESGFPSGEIDLVQYFAVRDAYCTHGQLLPFLIRKGKVLWQVEYDDAKLSDVVTTLRPADNTLRINVGIPQAGGPGVHDVLLLWQRFYEAIKAIEPLLGVGGGFVGIAAFLRRVMQHRRARKPPEPLASVPPGAVFSLVVREEKWGAEDLAKLVGITRRDAKNLLQLCRYRRRPGSRKYRRTAATDRVVRALNQVEQYDVD